MSESLKELSDCATEGTWFTVDPPWGDSDWINAGSPDPHGGRMVCVFEDRNDSWAEVEANAQEDLSTVQDDAAFVAALVNAYRSGQLHDATALAEAEARGRRQGLEEAGEIIDAERAKWGWLGNQGLDAAQDALDRLRSLATAPAETKKPDA